MHTVVPRAGRWPRALVVAALAALAACADEPVAPKNPTALEPKAAVQSWEPIEVVVTNTSGGTEVGSLRWAAQQTRYVGGAIVFDSTLGGKTITLQAGLDLHRPTEIVAPSKGVTISGTDQFRLIYSSDRLALTNVTLTKGYASFAAAIEGSTVELYHTTVTDNRSPYSAIFAHNLFLYNSTLSGNNVGYAAIEYGGSADVYINNSTIAFNAPGAGMGPITRPSIDLKVFVRNSIIANNGSQNCTNYFGIAPDSTTIVSDWSCADVGMRVADPQLLPLSYNGGPNKTHAIPHTSPAYNKGVDCWSDMDQRYVKRDAMCDIGAFEFNDSTKVTITIDPTVRLDATTGTGYALLTGTMKCTRDETIPLRLDLRQEQKVGKEVAQVHTTATTQVACNTTGATWARKMFLTSGAWQAGAAQATATTIYTPDWVAPASAASAVRLSVPRK